MPQQTYEEILVAGLKAQGWSEISGRSRYRTFSKHGSAKLLFVGNRGALRAGKCASDSFSIGDPARQTTFYKAVLASGQASLTSAKQS